MDIKGIDGMSVGEVQDQIRQGGKFVIYSYCISILVMTFKRSSDIHFLRSGDSAVLAGLPYTLLSLFLGWWGIPWGFIYTPMALVQNLGGGKDVTVEVMQSLGPG
ncbi:MAG: hypothetical protein IT380_00860 [Myxococcales bacterium]|nr:hypothetical protein [Myxococcales bacterium]